MSSPVIARLGPAPVVAVASCCALALAGLTGSSALALLALIVAAALAFVSPAGAIAGAIAALPYFYRPLGIGSQNVAASELLLLAAAVGTAFQALVSMTQSPAGALRDIRARLIQVFSSPIAVAAAGLVILGGLLVLMPFDPSHRAESLREWRWTLLEPALLLGLLFWHRRDRSLPELAAVALIAGGTVASLHALADYALGGGVAVGGVTRIAGPYPHPNALALMTVRIAALAFVWAVFDPRIRRWILPLLVICAVTFAATFSRGAMLAGLVAIALVLVHAPPRIRLVGAGSVVAALALAIAVAHDRMLDLFGGGSGSLRIDIWTSALRMIDDRPVRGYGPDQFLYAYLPRYVQPTAWGERFTAHAHNFMLDFWIRLGIIGAAFAGFVVLMCLLALARRLRGPWRSQPLGMAALVALIAVIANGLVDNAFFSHDLAMSCWLLAWLAFGVESEAAGAEGGVEIARAGVGRGWLYRLTPLR